MESRFRPVYSFLHLWWEPPGGEYLDSFCLKFFHKWYGLSFCGVPLPEQNEKIPNFTLRRSREVKLILNKVPMNYGYYVS